MELLQLQVELIGRCLVRTPFKMEGKNQGVKRGDNGTGEKGRRREVKHVFPTPRLSMYPDAAYLKDDSFGGCWFGWL